MTARKGNAKSVDLRGIPTIKGDPSIGKSKIFLDESKTPEKPKTLLSTNQLLTVELFDQLDKDTLIVSYNRMLRQNNSLKELLIHTTTNLVAQ